MNSITHCTPRFSKTPSIEEKEGGPFLNFMKRVWYAVKKKMMMIAPYTALKFASGSMVFASQANRVEAGSTNIKKNHGCCRFGNSHCLFCSALGRTKSFQTTMYHQINTPTSEKIHPLHINRIPKDRNPLAGFGAEPHERVKGEG